MTLTDKDGREVEIEVGGDCSDDISIDGAYFSENGEQAPSHIVDWLEANYAGEIHDEWVQAQVMRADFMADAWKDGTRD